MHDAIRDLQEQFGSASSDGPNIVNGLTVP
jgi:hypothetical protein